MQKKKRAIPYHKLKWSRARVKGVTRALGFDEQGKLKRNLSWGEYILIRQRAAQRKKEREITAPPS